MSQDKKILVTGGCGQLGVFVVNRLVEEGYELVVLDKSLPNSDTHVIFQKGKVKFYPCDLLHEDEVRNLSRELNQIQCAIHLASMVDGSVDVLGSAVASIKLNVLATINLLSLVPHLRHFVYASSMMVYGYPQLTPLPERHPTEPTNIYGVAKLAAE
ncbi:MAG: NAD(P)-dependent oxidoreductase, partial [Deltaproteobacteria bacterium]|nr:NAD(P)-dependent oxidoreductase [Deltaproteobacteria bacterium]